MLTRLKVTIFNKIAMRYWTQVDQLATEVGGALNKGHYALVAAKMQPFYDNYRNFMRFYRHPDGSRVTIDEVPPISFKDLEVAISRPDNVEMCKALHFLVEKLLYSIFEAGVLVKQELEVKV